MRLLLVEDVITTGATTAAAALSLLEGGAASVDVAALSRAAIWNSFRGHLYARLKP
jgi:predicted amidophosphoribosyltransferase